MGSVSLLFPGEDSLVLWQQDTGIQQAIAPFGNIQGREAHTSSDSKRKLKGTLGNGKEHNMPLTSKVGTVLEIKGTFLDEVRACGSCQQCAGFLSGRLNTMLVLLFSSVASLSPRGRVTHRSYWVTGPTSQLTEEVR